MKKILFLFVGILMLASCVNDNATQGTRTGKIISFTQASTFGVCTGVLELTPENSLTPKIFKFQIDPSDYNTVYGLTKAFEKGWKIKMSYHSPNRTTLDRQYPHWVDNITVIDTIN